MAYINAFCNLLLATHANIMRSLGADKMQYENALQMIAAAVNGVIQAGRPLMVCYLILHLEFKCSH